MIIALGIPIYRCDVAFFLNTTVDELEDFYKNNKDRVDSESYEVIKKDIKNAEEIGGAVYTCGVNYIVYIRDIRKKGYIDHELYHLTNTLLTDRGVEHSRNDEPFAYFNEYLHDEFRDMLKKYAKEIKAKKDDKTGETNSGSSEQSKESEEPQRRIHCSGKLGTKPAESPKVWRCNHILQY